MKRFLAVFYLIAISLFSGTYPSSAHTSLVSSQPKINEIVSSPIPEISLQFDEDLITLEGRDLNAITLTDGNGRSVSLGKTIVVGSIARASLDSFAMTSGTYYVQYRVVSGDGHVVSSRYQFTYSPVTDPQVSPQKLPVEDKYTSNTQELLSDTGSTAKESNTPFATSPKHDSIIHKHWNHIVYSFGGFAVLAIWFLIRRNRS